MRALGVLFLSASIAACSAPERNTAETAISPRVEQAFERLQADAKVRQALEAVKANDAAMFEEQRRITEIPAPPFKEAARAAYYLRKLQDAGLRDAAIDREGNVVGVRRGTGGPRLVVSAHLDTVFPEGTDVRVREKDGKFYAPGLGDDGLGLVTLLSVLQAMEKTGVRTVGDVIFVGTVGEEELGDLRGVKALFRERKDIDGFISIDGTTLGRIVNHATGSHRYEVAFRGPGGHSFAAFGQPSAIHAMGRAIAKIDELKPPADPKTTFTVGTVRGGTSVNAIAAEAVMGIDMRSDSSSELLRLEEQVMAAIRAAAAEENARWGSDAIRVELKLVGDRPAGTTSADSPIVQASRRGLSAVGARVLGVAGASTDSNIPISLGIPAVTLSGGGLGGASHSPGEWYSPLNAWVGTQSVLLTTLALVGVEGVSEPLLARR
ncbi:MAG: M20/M25/M40 family metallo-hydrolase [Betaproteobacteria bacterium]|nr:M20/M25/M40 family metallo-hydrolase [Betaproteobacteria bacterium]